MSIEKPLLLVTAAALIDAQNRVLLQQRPPGKHMAGMWEFPGGKVEPGESPEDCLVRELLEELGITTSAGDFEPLTFASHGYENFHLLMPLYACRHWQGETSAKEGQALSWRLPEEMADLPMPPADHPLVEFLRERY